MIPGLHIDNETESRVWKEFEGWAEHFQRDLRTSGIQGLIESYRNLVESVETQTCSHGAIRSGSNWSECCGISYEYLNDISVREAVDRILRIAPASATSQLKSAIRTLDDRLHATYPSGTSRDGAWWRSALPVHVAP